MEAAETLQSAHVLPWISHEFDMLIEFADQIKELSQSMRCINAAVVKEISKDSHSRRCTAEIRTNVAWRVNHEMASLIRRVLKDAPRELKRFILDRPKERSLESWRWKLEGQAFLEEDT